MMAQHRLEKQGRALVAGRARTLSGLSSPAVPLLQCSDHLLIKSQRLSCWRRACPAQKLPRAFPEERGRPAGWSPGRSFTCCGTSLRAVATLAPEALAALLLLEPTRHRPASGPLHVLFPNPGTPPPVPPFPGLFLPAHSQKPCRQLPCYFVFFQCLSFPRIIC